MSVCPYVRMSLYNDDCESSLNLHCDLDIHVEFLGTCAELTVSEFDAIFDKIPDMFCEEIQESLDSEMSELCFVLFFLRLLVIKRNGPLFQHMLDQGTSYFPPHLFQRSFQKTSDIVRCPTFYSIFDSVARKSMSEFVERFES